MFVIGKATLSTILLCGMAWGLAAQTNPTAQSDDWAHDPAVIRDFEQGRELRRAGKLEEAAAAYERVLKRAPKLAVAHLNLGLVRHDQHEYAASTKEFAAAASLDPSLIPARLYLGIDAYLWGHYETSQKALKEAVRLKPDDAESLYWLGLAQAGSGNLRSAAESLEEETRLRPKDDDGLYQLQEVYLQLWKATYERLVAANPDSVRIHQVLAEGYVQSNRLDDAKREYNLVLKSAPRLTGIHEALGDIARQQQQLPGAISEYRAELLQNPSAPRVWYKLADTLVDSGNLSEADQAAHSALKLQADCAPAYYVLGRIARQEKRPPEAIADFQKALTLGVKGELEESAHYQLFRLLLAAGKTAEANAHQREYLRLQQIRQQHALNIAEREHKVEGASESH